LIIEGDYYNFVTGDLMKATAELILGEQIYPREVNFRASLGVLLNALGQYEAGSEKIKRPFVLLVLLTYRFLIYTDCR